MAATLLDVEAVRVRFSSLRDGGFVFLDAPGGAQVPDEVGDAIARALREASANIGANYETSKRVERILATAREDAGSFLGCSSDDVVFGTNMTWLDFALSRTAARDWREGDRILVSRLDHDGGVAPWVELAADRGFEVEWVDVTEDLRLDYDDLANRLDDRVPRVDRRDGGDCSLRARPRATLPRRAPGRRNRLRAADDGRPGAHVPDQPRRGRCRRRGEAALRRGVRRLGARQLVLARSAREACVPGQRDPRRSHPLQQPGRDRPLQRRARPPLVSTNICSC